MVNYIKNMDKLLRSCYNGVIVGNSSKYIWGHAIVN